MRSTIALSMLLAAGMLVGCSLPAAPIAELPPPPVVPAEREGPLRPEPPLVPGSGPGPGCLASGDQNTINAQLRGPGDVAILCPHAVFELTGPVVFTAADQQVYTQGNPSGEARATLRIVASGLSTAVLMRDRDFAILSHVIVDGNRTNLGPIIDQALIYAGGYSQGQIIEGNRIMDPRSWSALQLIEGISPTQTCRNALVQNNEIGPAGTSDNLLWADGISFTCTNSTVRNNVITDATDGGIVVFGAPGSVIEDNTIRAATRTLLGGINMVDDVAYAGNFTGTIVRNNVIDASGAVIRIGLGMGPRVWGCIPANEAGHVLTGGTVTGNTLRGAHMQYGYAVDGVADWTVTGNIDEATHTGNPSQACGSLLASPPDGFQYNLAHSQGTFQPEFSPAQLDLALWAIASPRPGE